MSGPKHNSAGGLAAKIAIRELALAHVSRRSVLDLFCGPVGEMHRHVWGRARSYLGVDVVYRWPDRRRRIVAPWSFALEHLDLETFDVFDLDAFGSPWPALASLVRRRRAGVGELLALVVTDGSWRSIRVHSDGEQRRAFASLGVQAPTTLRELRPAAEAALVRAAGAMGCAVDGLRVAGYAPKKGNAAAMGYAVALLRGLGIR
jgi:hypothetical protein